MFCTEMGMKAEAHLKLINRLRGNTAGKDLVQTLERVVVSFKAANAFLDREPRFHGLFQRGETRQRRQIAVRCASAHNRIGN